jgi:hypothetical protein
VLKYARWSPRGDRNEERDAIELFLTDWLRKG